MIREAFLFLLKFNLLLIPFYAIIHFDVDFYPFQTFFAKSIVFVLNGLGLRAHNIDFFVYAGNNNFPIDISRDCIGWKSVYSLFAMVIASPGKFKDKGRFLLIWLPIMLLINIFRVFSTIFVGFLFGFHLMEFVHTVIWQSLVVLIIIGVWCLYIRKSYFKVKR
ncbi:hypothetical protein A3K63_05285 [Candidatus Micrarchaeota archaeon RBG_16_49_10]|nr:MAG: hypothetical protein A3K63_05285 [Candidatus Micrarchaeota archaeon RBG_16_49_10]